MEPKAKRDNSLTLIDLDAQEHESVKVTKFEDEKLHFPPNPLLFPPSSELTQNNFQTEPKQKPINSSDSPNLTPPISPSDQQQRQQETSIVQAVLAALHIEMEKMKSEVITTISSNLNSNNIASLKSQVDSMKNDVIESITANINAQNKNLLETVNSNSVQLASLTNRIADLELCNQNFINITELKVKVDNLGRANEKQTENGGPSSSKSSDVTPDKELEDQLDEIAQRVDVRDRAERKNNLIISNLLIKNVGETEFLSIWTQLSAVLNVKFDRDSVTSWKLLNKDSSTEYSTILVKLADFKLKQTIMKAYFVKKNLSNIDLKLSEINHRVYLNDNLTPRNAKIFKEAKNKFGQAHNKRPTLIKSVYIRNALIFVVKLDGEIVQLKSMKVLDELFEFLKSSSSQNEST